MTYCGHLNTSSNIYIKYRSFDFRKTKYVHETHNMSTHKFECTTELLTLVKGIFRKMAHICANGRCVMGDIEYYVHPPVYICPTYQTCTHIFEWMVNILKQCNDN